MGTLNLPNNLIEQLTAEAKAHGLSVEAFLQQVVNREKQSKLESDLLTPDEAKRRAQLLEEWFQSHRPRTKLADDSRESIYERDGE